MCDGTNPLKKLQNSYLSCNPTEDKQFWKMDG